MTSGKRSSSKASKTDWKRVRATKAHRNNASPFVWLPCLRCGAVSVPIATILVRSDGRGSTWNCRGRPCEAEHFLSIMRKDNKVVICYQRYTLRYPLEFYDEGVMPVDVRLYMGKSSETQFDETGYIGPVVVYPRKKRFSPAEVKAIWQATHGRCHICARRWRHDQRGVHGWHIDHVIPHGGGRETECTENFRVACAICNLRKGKGFTEAAIRLGLRNLVGSLAQP